MRKTLILAAAMVGSLASAQTGKTWEADLGTYTFLGCQRTGQDVICSLSYSQNAFTTHPISWSNSSVTTYDAAGRNASARDTAIAGDWGHSGGQSADVVGGVPVRIDFKLAVSNNTSTIYGLIIGNQRFQNVPVKGAATDRKSVV